MKNIKCPLCGKTPKFVTKDIEEIEVCQILCKCGLATEVNEYWLFPDGDPEEDELRAWKNWKKLVSKFPPIMRVWPGDKVKLFGERRARRIIGKNAGRGVLYLETFSGPPEPVRHDDVILWPWELNRKKEKNSKND